MCIFPVAKVLRGTSCCVSGVCSYFPIVAANSLLCYDAGDKLSGEFQHQSMTTLTAVFVRVCIEATYKSIDLLAALLCMQENMSSGDDTLVQWVVAMESQVADNNNLQRQERSAWKKHSIYKLPQGFVLDEKRLQAYKPKVVSLGPYHHGEEQVKAMEEHKRRVLRHLLVRTKKSLKQYRDALKGDGGGVLQFLMDSYKDLDKARWDDKEKFLEMTILDGCFMMEVMKLHTGKISPEQRAQEYDANDPIFSNHGMLSSLPLIKRDMLLIENQIPFLVLHKLNAVEKEDIQELDKEWVNNMVLEFFKQKTTETSSTPLPTTEQENSSVPPAAGDDVMDVQEYMSMGLHVLDVVRKSMIKEPTAGHRGRSGGSISSGFDVIWPATQLQEAGIKFRKSESPSLTDITFEERFLGLHATLSLPKLAVDDTTESKFLNLMAFEHLHMGSGKEVSSYVCFMDNIIDSDKDVSLLSHNNIIKNFVGTDQAVADLFNGICHDVSMDPTSNLNKVHRQVIKYCNKPRNKHCANLKHAYFNSPWSIIAVVAATVVLVITIIGFVYTLLSYYKHDA